ncbi:N-acetyltransferase [Mesorhizobium sp. L-8-10]|nr:N-acetyltransferase [Mesorhizobium sp. L-8-10]
MLAGRGPHRHHASMTNVLLRPARDGECGELSALCLRSKAVWGYDAAFLEACRAELSIRPADLDPGLLHVAEVDGKLVGVVQITPEGADLHLDKLFIDPGILRTGIGRRLLDWAVSRAAELGAARLVIDADPGAADFYRRMGATDAGVVASGSIPGRFLPRLELLLADPAGR